MCDGVSNVLCNHNGVYLCAICVCLQCVQKDRYNVYCLLNWFVLIGFVLFQFSTFVLLTRTLPLKGGEL